MLECLFSPIFSSTVGKMSDLLVSRNNERQLKTSVVQQDELCVNRGHCKRNPWHALACIASYKFIRLKGKKYKKLLEVGICMHLWQREGTWTHCVISFPTHHIQPIKNLLVRIANQLVSTVRCGELCRPLNSAVLWPSKKFLLSFYLLQDPQA